MAHSDSKVLFLCPTCACVRARAHACMRVFQRLALVVFLSHSPLYFLRQSLPIPLDWLAREPLFPPQYYDCIQCMLHPNFYMSAADRNPGPHSCASNFKDNHLILFFSSCTQLPERSCVPGATKFAGACGGRYFLVNTDFFPQHCQQSPG